METPLRKTVRIPLSINAADERPLFDVLVDMGYEWGLKFYKSTDPPESWVEMQLPDEIHFFSALRAIKHALRDMGIDAVPGEPLVIG